jgi:hypothetical protein
MKKTAVASIQTTYQAAVAEALSVAAMMRGNT